MRLNREGESVKAEASPGVHCEKKVITQVNYPLWRHWRDRGLAVLMA
jgi:hypothetical protein